MGRLGERRRDVLRLVGPVGLAWALAVTALAPQAAAQAPTSAVLWPTTTPAGDGATGELRLPTPKDGPLRERAREVDAILADAAQDLGLVLDLNARLPELPHAIRDHEVLEEARAHAAWIISPRIERDGGELLVRIVAARPGSKLVFVRTERTTVEALPVRIVVMLRDLVSQVTAAPTEAKRDEVRVDSKQPARSAGRGVLAVSTAAFGGFVGYSLQRTSRSDDVRLLYPLMALGTGIGLGASLIVAEEWDVGAGDAWYLAAGTWWSTASAMLLTTGYDVTPSTDRYAYGLAAGFGGTGLAAVALSQKGIGEGAATLTHSGAALGTFFGGMGELLARGESDVTPYKGMGYGSGAGLLLAGVVATQVEPSGTRVLAFDLGVGLGALAGAAVASPLLLKDAKAERKRAWDAATMAGGLLGGAGALWLTRGPSAPVKQASVPLPVPAVVAWSEVPGRGGAVPAFGALWSGRF